MAKLFFGFEVRLCLDFPLYLLGLQDIKANYKKAQDKEQSTHMKDITYLVISFFVSFLLVQTTKYVITRCPTLGIVLIVYL